MKRFKQWLPWLALIGLLLLGATRTQFFPHVTIKGGVIDETVIGGTTPAAGTFTDLAATSWGPITTIDVDGGTIDGVSIGSNSAATDVVTKGPHVDVRA